MKIRILGAGYGGLRAALDLDRWLGHRPDVRISLVDKNAYHQLATELHKPAAGTSEAHHLAIPLAVILRGTSVEFLQGAVTAIDPHRQCIVLDEEKVLGFDQLIVALGSAPEYFDIPGLEQNSLTIRSINSAQVIRAHVEAMLTEAVKQPDPDARRPYMTIVVAGGGFTGVEFAGELADRIPRLVRRLKLPREELRIITVEASSDILAGFDEALVDAAVRTLVRKRVSLLRGVPIVRVEPGAVVLQDGQRIESRSIIWTGGVRGNPLVERHLTARGRGRAVVNQYLQSVDSPDIYCIGDCALALNPRTQQPVAPTAQNAVQQGKIAARNILARYKGRPFVAYPATNLGVVATVGRGMGLAYLRGVRLRGPLPALLKDVNTLRYVYSLGGPALVLRFLFTLQPVRRLGRV